MSRYTVGPNRTVLFDGQVVPGTPDFNTVSDRLSADDLDAEVEKYVDSLNMAYDEAQDNLGNLLDDADEDADEDPDTVLWDEDEGELDEEGDEWGTEESLNPYNDEDRANGLILLSDQTDIHMELINYRTAIMENGFGDIAASATHIMHHMRDGEVREVMVSNETGDVEGYTGFRVLVRNGEVVQPGKDVYVTLNEMRKQVEMFENRKYFRGRTLHDYLTKQANVAMKTAKEMGFVSIDAVFNKNRMTSCVAVDQLGRRVILINDAGHRDHRATAYQHAMMTNVFSKILTNAPRGIEQVRRIRIADDNAGMIFENAVGQRLDIIPVKEPVNSSMEAESAPGM